MKKSAGPLVTADSSYPIQKGKLSGSKLSFEVLADQIYRVECTFEGDKLAGDVKPAEGGAGKISVTRAN